VIAPAGILVALIPLTIVLAVVFLVRPSVTAGVTGKILAFVALCILPALCIATGMSVHTRRSEQTRFCISCHSMESYGKSLYLDDTKYVPAQHFQNHRVPADMACYTCHSDYTIFGHLKDKLKGITRIYLQYVSSPPNPITIPRGFKNAQCLHCHGEARDFEENPVHSAMMSTLTSNQLSCISTGCHDAVHDASNVNHLKMWRPGP
jgi:cytochrome c-type protein NapC